MNLKPLGDRVIVKRDEAETKTASGLYIASSAQEKPQTGIVLAVGEGKRDKDGNLIGNPVNYRDSRTDGMLEEIGKFGGTEVNIEGEDVLIMRADDLYGVYTA